MIYPGNHLNRRKGASLVGPVPANCLLRVDGCHIFKTRGSRLGRDPLDLLESVARPGSARDSWAIDTDGIATGRCRCRHVGGATLCLDGCSGLGLSMAGPLQG
jgi:hypothetical protein